MIGGLDDCVLLGVQPPAKLVPLARGYARLLTDAAQVQAVSEAARGPVVAGGEDALLLHDEGADYSS